MAQLQIDVTDLEDIKILKNTVVAESIIAAAREILDAGGSVTLKRSYCNTSNDNFRVYSSATAFESDWRAWLI